MRASMKANPPRRRNIRPRRQLRTQAVREDLLLATNLQAANRIQETIHPAHQATPPTIPAQAQAAITQLTRGTPGERSMARGIRGQRLQMGRRPTGMTATSHAIQGPRTIREAEIVILDRQAEIIMTAWQAESVILDAVRNTTPAARNIMTRIPPITKRRAI